MTEHEFIQQALQRPLTDEQCRPVDMRLDRREGLTIQWADGVMSKYTLVYLRRHCPCATCRTEREEAGRAARGAGHRLEAGAAPVAGATPAATGRGGTTGAGGLSLTILPPGISKAAEFVDAKLVGSYAMQIVWGDGHQTGIYDFRYLRAIDPQSTRGDAGI